MWVINTGGNIDPGDLLISCDGCGCAMRDDPAEFPVGHIVARAAQAMRWGGVDISPGGVRRATISVLFGSFRRGPDRPSLIESQLAEKDIEIEALRADVEALREVQVRHADLKTRVAGLENIFLAQGSNKSSAFSALAVNPIVASGLLGFTLLLVR